MQKRVVSVETVCDLCQNPIDQAGTAFSYDGVQYLIDVCPTHKAELSGAFAPFVAAARKIGRIGTLNAPARAKQAQPAPNGKVPAPAPARSAKAPAVAPAPAPQAPSPAKANPSTPMAEIRAWARDEGGFIDIPKGGILKPEVIQAFEAAKAAAAAPASPYPSRP